MRIPNALLGVLPLASVLFSCMSSDRLSQPKKIFVDQQREDIPFASVPYMLRIGSRCSGFIIDSEKLIGITANHCRVAVDTDICYGTEKLDAECGDESKGSITKLIESRAILDLDYAIFQFKLASSPQGMRSIRLSNSPQLIRSLIDGRDPIRLIGYPGDKYRKGKLTQSHCRVRGTEDDLFREKRAAAENEPFDVVARTISPST